MRLNYLEMKGFKSFQEKTKLVFEKDVSAIVGPNGSGKSNISDAIRWVLGEQSAKSLRGQRMEDIIFSGTQVRKPMNMAEVTLSIDNSSKDIPIEYETVDITRRVFRTGDSEYLLNKSKARLKDIRELFFDTGIGKDGYSIIGQGRIDDILSGKSEDRRYIFEEACGISKHKYKKNISEKEIEKNEKLLEDLNTDLKIMEKENKLLKKEAENAMRGEKLKKELFDYELSYIKNYLSKQNSILLKKEETISFLKKELTSLDKKVKEIDENIYPLEANIELFYKKSSDLSKETQKNNNLLIDYKNECSLLKQKLDFHKKDYERIKKEKKEMEKKFKDNKSLLEDLSKEEDEIISNFESIQKNLLKNTEKLKSFMDKKVLLEKETEEIAIELSDKEQEINKIKISIDTDSRLNKNKEDERQDIIIEIEDLDSQKELLLEEKERTQIIYNNKKNTLIDIDNQLKSISKQVQDTNDNLNKDYTRLNTIKNEITSLETRNKILGQIKNNYEGFYLPVQRLMKKKEKDIEIDKKIIGVLAELIEVSPKYKLAIDVSLGSALQNIVVKDELDAKYLIDYITKNNIGRLTFLPLSRIKSYKKKTQIDTKLLVMAKDAIKYPRELEDIMDHYLARTVIVENIEDAIAVSKKIKGYKIVTLKGEVINSWGSMVGGNVYKKENNSLLNRDIELLDLKKQIKILKNNKIEIEKNIENLIKHEAYLKKLKNEMEIEKNSLLNKLENKSIKLKEMEFNIEFLQVQRKKLKEKIKSINTDKTLYTKEFLNSKISQRDTILEKSTFYRVELEDVTNNILELEKKEIIKENELSGYRRDLQLLKNKILDINEENENIISSVKFYDGNIDNYKETIDKLDSKIKLLENDIDKCSKKLLINKKELKSIEEESNKDQSKIDLLKKEKENILLNKEKKERDLFKINFELESLEKAIRDKLVDSSLTYKLSVDKLIELIESNKLVYSEEIEERTSRIREELSKIGYYNLESIEEYEKSKLEIDFLTNQFQDLASSTNDILKMIENLEREMESLFLLTFEDINNRFKNIFKILFNGGEAELILKGDNPLSAEIEIVARPPGKRLANIDLLSGGEKSLTAVALLFAIFETKPAPFCILDEIDAALDEANIYRYINYLKSMTEKTQFIIITHRKTTMEMSDILYGVTMEEKGVSKVVTLAFDDYREE